MLKNILIKTAEIVNRDDLLLAIKKATSIEEIENENIKSDILKLISYFNFIINDIFENYFNLNTTETIASDENNRIYYSNLKFKPSKIISVKTPENTQTIFTIYSTFISTNSPNLEYKVEYNYIPDDILDFNVEIELPINLNTKTICYGIASEFLASKDQFEKSEFWKNKYLFEIFKSKIKKERHLKSTFWKWN